MRLPLARMSIELVDKIDQAHKSTRRYKKVGGLNDLFLHDEEASVSSHTTTGDEYVGLELETIIEKKAKKRVAKFLLFAIVLAVLIAVAVAFHRTNSTAAASPSSGNGGSHGGNNHDTDVETLGGNHPITGQQNNSDGGITINPTTHVADVIIPTAAPLPKFDICKPILHFKNHTTRIHHMTDVVIVPENKDSDNQWNYTFSALDIDEHASIIAVGLSDFSGPTDYSLGMVRVFAFSCLTKSFEQLGQDLLGRKPGEQFGQSVSSSKDGKVMAVSAPQEDYDGGNGFVDVYFLDGNSWSQLGQRIEELDFSQEYTSLGSAIDLSDNGQSLAVVAVNGETSCVTRVFDYDSNSKQWVRKGHDLSITVDANAQGYGFSPDVSLSEAGNELSVVDPSVGLIKYHFDFEKNVWIKGKDVRKAIFEMNSWIEDVACDDSGDILSATAFMYNTGGDDLQVAKVFDFTNKNGTEIYNKTVLDIQVSLNTAVSNDGGVVAVVASRENVDDNSYWSYDDIGAMTILSKSKFGVWEILGQGSDCENLGVPGGEVTLSGDGSIAAVGSDSKIAIYVVTLNHDPNNVTTVTTDGQQTPGADKNIDDSTKAPNVTAANATFFKICAPFSNSSAGHVGDIGSLPKQEDQHSLAVALSGDGSLVAVGIGSGNDEDRGMVRVFAWDCANGTYSKWGQDLFGANKFDAFGQSVDLSSDGKVLVVGANQPQPGKAGYVDIYKFGDHGLWSLEERFEEVYPSVEDIGREVRISSDGSTVAIHGSFVDVVDGGFTVSFIRVIEKKNGKWVSKGDDLIGSISYDDYGNNVKLSFAADGVRLGVTGSYSSFMAKIYSFDSKKSNWTETIIPPIKLSEDHDDEFDELCEEYFDGDDIALSDDGQSVAVAGLQWGTASPVVRVLKVGAGGNWTMSHDPVNYVGDYIANSISLSGDAQVLAVGINVHADDKADQGAMFISQADTSDGGWKRLGQIDGRAKSDLLGSRVRMSSNGRLAAASSRKGYVSFFKVDEAKA